MTGGGTSFEICKFFGKIKFCIGKTSSMIGHIWHALFAVKTCSGKKGHTQCRELPLCAGSGEGCQWQALPRLCNARRPRLESGTFRS